MSQLGLYDAIEEAVQLNGHLGFHVQVFSTEK
jgi:hypothetical protein